jgi:Sugar (and other) transporter
MSGTILQIVNSSVTIFSCIYFYFISSYWLWFQLFSLLLNLLVVVCVVFMPESPKYLITKRRYEECRQVITRMIRYNKGPEAEPFRGKFDKEIIESNGVPIKADIAE